jgi:hypothetical protein
VAIQMQFVKAQAAGMRPCGPDGAIQGKFATHHGAWLGSGYVFFKIGLNPFAVPVRRI